MLHTFEQNEANVEFRERMIENLQENKSLLNKFENLRKRE